MKLRLGICQVNVSGRKDDDIAAAKKLIEGVACSADVVVLPECFSSPYDTQLFHMYAESVTDDNPGPSLRMLKQVAKDCDVWIIGGTIPEISEADGGKIFNTCPIVNPDGVLVAKHRKCHMFDVDIPGTKDGVPGITFRESETISPGTGGLGHWELLARTRALDTQCFVAAVAPARNMGSSYVSWSHSTVSCPKGRILEDCGVDEVAKVVELDLAEVDAARTEIPVLISLRGDLYKLER